MKKDRVIELLEEQNRHFKEQIKAADQREQQSQRLICELTSQVKQLTDAVQSLEEALTLKNGKLKKQENISRSLSKLISNESEKQIPDKPKSPPPIICWVKRLFCSKTSMKHSGKWCLKIPTSVVTKHITKYWFRKRTVKAKGYEKGISGQRRQRP